MDTGYNSGQGYSSPQYGGTGVGGYPNAPPQGYSPQAYNIPNPYAAQPGYPHQPYPNNQYNQQAYPPPPSYPPQAYPPPPPTYPPPAYPPQTAYPPPAYPPQTAYPPPTYPPQPAYPPQQPAYVPPPVPPPVAPIAPVAPVTPIVSIPNPSPIIQPLGPNPMANQGVDKYCQILHYAMKGVGTDENAIINVVCNTDTMTRAEIRRRYIALYGKDLIKRLKEDLSGNFEDTVVGMFMTPPEYDAYCLYKAMKGLGTNEGVLIEIIGTRNNLQIQMIKAEFLKNYGKTLEKWITSETSGHFRKLLISLIQANRSMNTMPDPMMCQNDAQALYAAGEGRWGTDESTFVRIFTQRSAAELDLISRSYQQLRGRNLHHAIDKEFSGDTKKLLHTILEGLQNVSAYYAKRIRESVEGVGTNDSRLVRCIVSRCEIDMPLIKQEYRRMYGRDLVHDVRSDTSGDYKKILTFLLTRV